MDDLASQPLVSFVNAFSGVYAACVWGFFAVLRARAGEWWWVAADVAVSVCGVAVTVVYWLAATDPAAGMVGALRLLVVPVLVLPTVVHVALWRETREFLHRAEEVDGDVE